MLIGQTRPNVVLSQGGTPMASHLSSRHEIEHFFGHHAIVRRLVRIRLEEARKRRRAQFISRLADATNGQPPRSFVAKLLPPRSQWSRCRPTLEERKNHSVRSIDILRERLSRYVVTQLSSATSEYRWVERLREFLTDVQTTGLGWNPEKGHVLEPEYIIPIPKTTPGHNQKYRVLAIYSLKDRMLMASFGAYLRSIVDATLSDSCMAFRLPQPGKKPISHHDAVRRIQLFRQLFSPGEPVWATECDIQGFFDAVNHGYAQQSIEDAAALANVSIDHRAMAFLRSFFRGYSYTGIARPKALQMLTAAGIRNPILADPVSSLRKTGIEIDQETSPIGIPQGSAISTVIANTVLRSADQQVLSVLDSYGGRKLYMRYCDDILICHEHRDATFDALDAYTRELKRLHLPLHEPQKVGEYGRQFWQQKSKLPYQWSANTNKDNKVPWLSFVGYQVHRDGRVRVRKSSIEKEITKQKKVVDDFSKAIQRKTSASEEPPMIPPPRIVRARVEAHLISIGVGYPSHCPPGAPSPSGISWAAGFEGLLGQPVHESGLRRLDRHRNLMIRRAENIAAQYIANGQAVPLESNAERATTAPPPDERLVDSAALSYVYYFRRQSSSSRNSP